MLKKLVKVAFQGERGAYSEEAAFNFFGEKIETLPCQTFREVFKFVEDGKVDFGIVPVENSLEGTVGSVYDLFLRYTLKPYGEFFLRVRHCLISFPGQTLNSIKGVYSHPQALGQCRGFLEKKKYKTIPFYDTASSVKMLKEKKMTNWAAIASEKAAKIYGMKVLKRRIEDNPQNFTRFLALSKREKEPTGNDKTSVIFGLKHIPGALFAVLKIFAERKINLTKLESRPLLGHPWEYNFILEFEGYKKEKKISSALKDLREKTTFLKVIGSFPAASSLQRDVEKNKLGIKRVAIVGGAGGMGFWFSKFFSENGMEVVAADKNRKKLKKIREALVVETETTNKKAIEGAGLVLVAVPPRELEKAIKDISPFLKKDQIVMDITSLKVFPIKIMHKHLRGKLVLASHPLFGPGAREAGLNFVLTPTNKRERDFAKRFGDWLEDRGFNVIMLSPGEHDKLMAWILGFSHFVGLAVGSTLLETNLKKLVRASGPSFQTLFNLVKNVASSSPEIYSQIHFSLPGVSEIEKEFEEKVRFWSKIVKNGDEKKFIREMKKLRRSLKMKSKL